MKVSVIVPNYNHARFLDKRLSSILNQTFQDFELIFLDDASTDNSREVFARYTDDPRVRSIFNSVNSGSVFKQWNLGFREAKGEYIWIAESDDFADETFLEVLVEKLDRYSTAGIAYCQSRIVNEDGDGQYIVEEVWWGEQLDPARWKHDYFNDGRKELADFFSQRCIVANASSALIRRSVVEAVGYADEGYLCAGDWRFWSKMLMGGDIVFAARPLNYWREHSSTARERTVANGAVFTESLSVIDSISRKISVPPAKRRAAYRYYGKLWLEHDCPARLGLSRSLKMVSRICACDPGFLIPVLKYLDHRRRVLLSRFPVYSMLSRVKGRLYSFIKRS